MSVQYYKDTEGRKYAYLPPTDTAEQEWTVDNMVENYPSLHGLREEFQKLVTAINAALDAEREKWQLATEECHRIISRKNELLAAERENGLNAVAGLERNHAHEIWKLEQQLAAERERTKRVSGLGADAYNQLRSQLAAEREWKNEYLRQVGVSDALVAKLEAQLAAEREKVRQGLECITTRTRERDSYIEEAIQLREWKQSAISTMPDYQAIGKELGWTIGTEGHRELLPSIRKLKERLDRNTRIKVEIADLQDDNKQLRAQLAELQGPDAALAKVRSEV